MRQYIVLIIWIGILLISCNQNEQGRVSANLEAHSINEQYLPEEKSPLKLGQEIAMKTQRLLGQNLLEAINSKGTEHALSFCSTKAIPLTDSMAVSLNTTIKRVSDKNRNPNNKANSSELEYINYSKTALANNQTIKPKLIKAEYKDIAYYPILTNNMCLQCHGEPKEDISLASLSTINLLYPNDKATGYASEELRGIWVIEMDKSINLSHKIFDLRKHSFIDSTFIGPVLYCTVEFTKWNCNEFVS